jgi:hypothetical protein
MTTELQRYDAFIEEAKGLLDKNPNIQTRVKVTGGRGTPSGEVEGCIRTYEIIRDREVLLQYHITGVRYDDWREAGQDEAESLQLFRQTLGLEDKLEKE